MLTLLKLYYTEETSLMNQNEEDEEENNENNAQLEVRHSNGALHAVSCLAIESGAIITRSN